MTIREYYLNYKTNKKMGKPLKGTQNDATISDFYDNCISDYVLQEKDVVAWHNMFMEYIKRPDAILWVRYYESGNKKSGRWNNRRACKTQFSDGFSYVFVSNYDAHEIYNMVRLGVTPDVDEFYEMMKNYEFPLHHDSGKSCEEADIACYPPIGSTRGGILTTDYLYLAHINGIKSDFLRDDGTCTELSKSEVAHIFPRGNIEDWQTVDGKSVRMITGYTLSTEEKELVKAHFLRFVDPLNYYVVPGRNYETNDVCAVIGEHKNLNLYVTEKFEGTFKKVVMDEFRSAARIAAPTLPANGSEVINITYGPTKCSGTASGSTKSSKSKKSSKTSKAKPASAAPAMTSSVGIGSGMKIGKYAKGVFTKLLTSGQLSAAQIRDLSDKNYCSRTFKLSYAVLVDSSADSKYYYKDALVLGKYMICREWKEISRDPIDNWITKNGFKI